MESTVEANLGRYPFTPAPRAAVALSRGCGRQCLGRALSVCALLISGCFLSGCGESSQEPGETAAPVEKIPTPSEAPAEEDLGPPKRLFAKRFVVKVRKGPGRDTPRIGYLRGGVVMQATSAEPVEGPGCRRGWWQLTTGGYVCNRRDVIAFLGDRLPAVRAAQPDRERPLPYVYAVARRNHIPVYKRLPNDTEAAIHEGYKVPGHVLVDGVLVPQSQAPQAPPSPDEGTPAGLGQGVSAAEAKPEAKPDTLPADANLSDHGLAVSGDGAEVAEEPEGPPTLDSLLATEDETVLLRRMLRGFFVSLDREFEVGRRRYYRSQQNEYIPASALMEVEGSDFSGVSLTDGRNLPIAYVVDRRARRFEQRGTRPPRATGPATRRFVFETKSDETHGRTRYLGPGDGSLYRERDLVVIEAQARPEGVGEHEKWIDVDLTRQSLVAYEGNNPIFATLISSGRIRRENVPELDHRTPTGLFRVSAKHLTHQMDGDNAIDGPYSIQDVPYVQYFQLAFAIHTAFWHDRFGRPKSHGCVNMSPADARWLFGWTDPPLPHGWHGAYPSEQVPGTWIHIHGETPKG